jgi:thiol-disulfide isomerase/thioredoxin
MTEPAPQRPPTLRPRRVLVIAALSAVVALAITLYVGNVAAPQQSQCPAQAHAAQQIDAAATGELAALNGTGLGRGYADMTFTDAAGKPISIAAFAGRKLLVNFWASWCIPCRAEMPELQALAQKYNSDSFEVVTINLDIGEGAMDKAKAFLAAGSFPDLPLYADPTFKAFERLKTEGVALGLPATLLLDDKGCELGVLQGPAVWNSPDGDNVIKALLSV